MFSVSFIFRPGAYDEEFHRLDAATQAIDEATNEIANMVSSHKAKPIEVMSKIEAACEYVRRNRYMCDLHKKLEPGMDIESCHVCEQ